MNLLKKLMGIETAKDRSSQIREREIFGNIPQEIYPKHVFSPGFEDIVANELRDDSGKIQGGRVYEETSDSNDILIASYDAEQWKVFQKDLEAARKKIEFEEFKKTQGDKPFEDANQRITMSSVANEDGRIITMAIPIMKIDGDKVVNVGANIYTKDQIYGSDAVCGASVSGEPNKVKTVGSAEWNKIVEAHTLAQSKLIMNAKATKNK